MTGGLGGVLGRLPEFTLPQLPDPLKPSRAMRSSTFEVIYLDGDLRITRGDRGRAAHVCPHPDLAACSSAPDLAEPETHACAHRTVVQTEC